MFKRLPTAWLQLRHQNVRLIVALSGVIFAVVIVFMQLGIQFTKYFDSSRLSIIKLLTTLQIHLAYIIPL
jgi:putative ABC transport system permease protein